MKIQIDNEVRDMTPEEEAELLAWHDNTPSPDENAGEILDILLGGEGE